MANVNKLALCPKCKIEIDFPLPPKCPECSFELKKAANEHFNLPDYVSCQYEDYREELGMYKDEEVSADKKKELDTIVASLWKWCRDCTGLDKISAMSDAHLIVKHLLHSNSSTEHRKAIVNIGKKIGDLCANIDDYYKKGGSDESPPVTYKKEYTGDPRLDIDQLDIK